MRSQRNQAKQRNQAVREEPGGQRGTRRSGRIQAFTEEPGGQRNQAVRGTRRSKRKQATQRNQAVRGTRRSQRNQVTQRNQAVREEPGDTEEPGEEPGSQRNKAVTEEPGGHRGTRRFICLLPSVGSQPIQLFPQHIVLHTSVTMNDPSMHPAEPLQERWALKKSCTLSYK
ncbi:unnamed protein product [Boreogadus saida]